MKKIIRKLTNLGSLVVQIFKGQVEQVVIKNKLKQIENERQELLRQIVNGTAKDNITAKFANLHHREKLLTSERYRETFKILQKINKDKKNAKKQRK